MTQILSTALILGVTLIGAGWGGHILTQKPIEAPQEKEFVHGTKSWKVLPTKGAFFEVKGHFFVHDRNHPKAISEATAYATGQSLSVHRAFDEEPEEQNNKPAVLVVKPVEGQSAYMKKGFWGGDRYFCDGTILEVRDIIHIDEGNSPTVKSPLTDHLVVQKMDGGPF